MQESDKTNALKFDFFNKIAMSSLSLPLGNVKPAAKVGVATSMATIKLLSPAFLIKDMFEPSLGLLSMLFFLVIVLVHSLLPA